LPDKFKINIYLDLLNIANEKMFMKKSEFFTEDKIYLSEEFISPVENLPDSSQITTY